MCLKFITNIFKTNNMAATTPTNNYTPLINNIVPTPLYNGIPIKLGSTPAHLSKKPNLVKINGKKITYICIGASTPGQISTVIETLTKSFTNVQVFNCCVGAQDINDWLLPDGAGWNNVESVLKSKNVLMSEVQGIFMCHDDLKDSSNIFPASAISLKDKIKSFIGMAKINLPALKHVELFSRLCEYKITDPKFQTPSGYHNGFANKFLVEDCIAAGSKLFGDVFVNDSCGYLFSNGETVRSDGFAFKFSWMKQKQTSIHLDTRLSGDDVCANHIVTNTKLTFPWFF